MSTYNLQYNPNPQVLEDLRNGVPFVDIFDRYYIDSDDNSINFAHFISDFILLLNNNQNLGLNKINFKSLEYVPDIDKGSVECICKLGLKAILRSNDAEDAGDKIDVVLSQLDEKSNKFFMYFMQDIYNPCTEDAVFIANLCAGNAIFRQTFAVKFNFFIKKTINKLDHAERRMVYHTILPLLSDIETRDVKLEIFIRACKTFSPISSDEQKKISQFIELLKRVIDKNLHEPTKAVPAEKHVYAITEIVRNIKFLSTQVFTSLEKITHLPNDESIELFQNELLRLPIIVRHHFVNIVGLLAIDKKPLSIDKNHLLIKWMADCFLKNEPHHISEATSLLLKLFVKPQENIYPFALFQETLSAIKNFGLFWKKVTMYLNTLPRDQQIIVLIHFIFRIRDFSKADRKFKEAVFQTLERLIDMDHVPRTLFLKGQFSVLTSYEDVVLVRKLSLLSTEERNQVYSDVTPYDIKYIFPIPSYMLMALSLPTLHRNELLQVINDSLAKINIRDNLFKLIELIPPEKKQTITHIINIIEFYKKISGLDGMSEFLNCVEALPIHQRTLENLNRLGSLVIFNKHQIHYWLTGFPIEERSMALIEEIAKLRNDREMAKHLTIPKEEIRVLLSGLKKLFKDSYSIEDHIYLIKALRKVSPSLREDIINDIKEKADESLYLYEDGIYSYPFYEPSLFRFCSVFPKLHRSKGFFDVFKLFVYSDLNPNMFELTPPQKRVQALIDASSFISSNSITEPIFLTCCFVICGQPGGTELLKNPPNVLLKKCLAERLRISLMLSLFSPEMREKLLTCNMVINSPSPNFNKLLDMLTELPFQIHSPNLLDLMCSIYEIPEDQKGVLFLISPRNYFSANLQFAFQGYTDESVRQFFAYIHILNETRSHLTKLLVSDLNPKTLDLIAQYILTHTTLLGITSDNDPLYKLAQNARVVCKPEELKREKSPYKVHGVITNVVPEEPFLDVNLPTEYVGGRKVKLNIDHMRKMGEWSGYTSEDLHEGISENTLTDLFSVMEDRLKSLSSEEYSRTCKDILEICELKVKPESIFDFLKKSLLASPYITVLYQESSVIPAAKVHLYAILKAILDESNVINTCETLSPQERSLMTMASMVQFCDTGQYDGLERCYRFLSSEYMVNRESKGANKIVAFIDKLVQDMLLELSENVEFLKEVTENPNLGQKNHTVNYIFNRYYRQMGLRYKPKFDFYTGVLDDPLVKRWPGDTLGIIFSYVTPTLIVEKLIQRVQDNFSDVFLEMEVLLKTSNMELLEKGYLTSDEDMENFELTEKGAVALLEAAGYLTRDKGLSIK